MCLLCSMCLDNGFHVQLRQNIFEFMHEKCGLSREISAESVWRPLFQRYNQTLRSLREYGFEFDVEEYWRYVRRDQANFLHTDLELRAILQAMPFQKWYEQNNTYRVLTLWLTGERLLKDFHKLPRTGSVGSIGITRRGGFVSRHLRHRFHGRFLQT